MNKLYCPRIRCNDKSQTASRVAQAFLPRHRLAHRIGLKRGSQLARLLDCAFWAHLDGAERVREPVAATISTACYCAPSNALCFSCSPVYLPLLSTANIQLLSLSGRPADRPPSNPLSCIPLTVRESDPHGQSGPQRRTAIKTPSVASPANQPIERPSNCLPVCLIMSILCSLGPLSLQIAMQIKLARRL